MKNISKTTKTILFASLIAAMILPTSMMGNAEAATTYTREQVNQAFSLAGDNVTFNDKNKMKVDKAALSNDGMSQSDIKIIKEYAKLHNALIKAMIQEDEDKIEDAQDKLVYGDFAIVFNDPSAGEGISTQGWFDDNACGITNGNTSTYPDTPTLYVGTDDHANENAIETWLENNGQHIVNWPYADWGDLVYAEENSTGQGGCTSGEFRDEWNVYDDSPAHYIQGSWTTGWHTLNHDNEPNPEVLSYSSPTYWWIGFVVYWHDNY